MSGRWARPTPETLCDAFETKIMAAGNHLVIRIAWMNERGRARLGGRELFLFVRSLEGVPRCEASHMVADRSDDTPETFEWSREAHARHGGINDGLEVRDRIAGGFGFFWRVGIGFPDAARGL